MAQVFYPNGDARLVNNLGWLLVHRKDGIDHVQVIGLANGDAWLQVVFQSGITYQIKFADLSVCMNWVVRKLRRYMSQTNLGELTHKFSDRLVQYGSLDSRYLGFGWPARQ
jgi:hypothetical protein